jgi:tetratricopeptide (TPR) repeat protein
MGNNEVVGPFGAGTIFGRKTPPLPFIRASLALKATRLGQLFDSVRPWFQPAASVAEEWGGMGMFLNYQVSATDPRMEKIYDYYAQNLHDIIDVGRRAGTGMVVSSVAVNLKDCAPFASEHRAGLSTSEKEAWDRFWQDGITAQANSQTAVAVEKFRAASRIDDSFAELRFRQGECALAQHDDGEAQRQFRVARDLDTLRFRCDSTLNDLARRIASQRAGERVLFTDAERIFGEQSDDGLPGNNFFYEHVHLNFAGNYLLARSIAQQVEKLIARESGAAWPTLEDCKRRLGWTDYDRLEAIRQIADRMGAPPFTGQCHHEAQMNALGALLENLAAAAQPAGILASENACRAAQAIAPNDPELESQMAALAAAAGDFPQAIVEQKRSLDAIPSDAARWANLGLYLMSQKQFSAAPPAFQHAIDLDPVDASLTKDFAHALWKAGRLAEAEAAYHKALKAQPERAITWLDYGRFLEETGRKPEASNCYARAVSGRGKTGADFVALAHFCESRSWFAAASSNYLSAIRVDPVDPKLRVDAGGNFALSGDNPRAEEQFRQALRLEPGLVKTRLNLAVALMKEGRAPAARRELDLVLQQEPGNAVAAQYAGMLRSNSIPAPSQP